MKAASKSLLNNTVYAFENRWDLVVFIIAVLISSSLLAEKLYFIFSVYGQGISLPDSVLIVFTNVIVFVTLCFWVVLLLAKNSHVLLRAYVLLFGFFLYLQLRLIQSGELTTRQGVEFPLIEHLVLMVAGHEPWKQFFLENFVKFQVPVIFFLAFVLKIKLSPEHAFNYRSLLVFISIFSVSFSSPKIEGVPTSLAHNSLIHVIKTAWFPVADVHIEGSMNFAFKKETEPSLSSKYVPRNVVLIILESTGANMLDFYGSEDAVKGSTPFLSELASKSLKFTDTQAVMTSTSKSLVSILCGIEPYFGLSNFNATLGIPVNCLPERLADLGYQTAFFQSAHDFYERRDLLVQKMGFEHFVAMETLPENEKTNARTANVFGMEDEVLLSENQRWLEGVKLNQKAFFTTYLTLAQHFPYYSPDKDRTLTLNTSERYRDAFVNSLTYVDGFLEKLVKQYKQTDLYENTIFIVVGDHGESFGFHHPQRFHNNSMYREGIWVPFFIVNENLFPELEENDEIKSLMDVSPTVEALLGLNVSSQYRGVQALLNSSGRMVFSVCWYPKSCVSAINENYKYIYNFEDMPEELYERKIDFLEQNNLAMQHPELVENFRKQTLQWYSNTQGAYENYFLFINKNYKDDPASYYQFPIEFFTRRLQLKSRLSE